eukprot:355528-Chlamydomonas_euryale.AAC.14
MCVPGVASCMRAAGLHCATDIQVKDHLLLVCRLWRGALVASGPMHCPTCFQVVTVSLGGFEVDASLKQRYLIVRWPGAWLEATASAEGVGRAGEAGRAERQVVAVPASAVAYAAAFAAA